MNAGSEMYGGVIVYAIAAFTTAITGAATLVEGASLAGAKLLAGRQDTVSKVAKYILATLALTAALTVTCGVGLSVWMFVGIQGGNLASSLVIPAIAGTLAALLTIPCHLHAFKWSKLWP